MDYNVLFVLCDTLRRDIINLYGGPVRMQNLSNLARDGVVYNDAISPSPWTIPAHVSFFSGMYLNEHGIHETQKLRTWHVTNNNKSIKDRLISGILSRRGYNTLGISTNLLVSTITGLDAGFNTFFNLDTVPTRYQLRQDKDLIKMVRSGYSNSEIAVSLLKKMKINTLFKYGLAYLKTRSTEKALNFPFDKGASAVNMILSSSNWNEPFFRFINLMEVHEPYRHSSYRGPQENFKSERNKRREMSRVKTEYMKEAEYLDLMLGKILLTLKKQGVYDDTMVIVTSDHGQAFNEHGYIDHGVYLYDELVRVPMVIKYPKNRKFERKKGYQSLVNLPKVIVSATEGGDDSDLTTESAFSESYGLNVPISGRDLKNNRPLVNLYERPRKAVFEGGFKLTIEGKTGRIEEFMKDGKDVSNDIKYSKVRKELIDKIDIFKGQEKFLLPE
ncbi:MAG: sulfatase [Candidatus Parvarchaeota archaeon]|nr:sulfatase [Candidatus Parvarchaeota archaeon]